MSLREVITESRDDMYRDVAAASNAEDIELIIERIDGIGDRLAEVESEQINLNLRIDRIEQGVK